MRRIAYAGILLGLFATRARAADFKLAVTDIRVDSTYVRSDFILTDPLPEETGDQPTESTPAALAYTLELWRERASWFDALVSSRTYGFRLEYDHLREVYRVAMPGGQVLETSDRQELLEWICRQSDVIGARVLDLEPGRKYYFAVTARLTPIDLNQLGEVEDWLSGEIRTGTHHRGILGVPKAVVGILADIAGFGDRSTVARSFHFRASGAGQGIERLPE